MRAEKAGGACFMTKAKQERRNKHHSDARGARVQGKQYIHLKRQDDGTTVNRPIAARQSHHRVSGRVAPSSAKNRSTRSQRYS